MAGCRPEHAVMIGDRLDNDVRPAKAPGMKTIRVRRGTAAHAAPSCDEEMPDHTVDDLSKLLNIV